MDLRNLFKPKWQHPKAEARMAALAKIKCLKKLRKIATQSTDEQIRFEAARRLADISLISILARSAARDTVRLEAALLIRDQAALAAIALNDWDIERGQTAVDAIDIDLLLHRIARAAQQDAIRLAAAMKLEKPELIREVAETTNDIQIRWRVACCLDDPYLMAQIALYKPANERMTSLRKKACKAYLAYLDQCREKGRHQALLAILHTVDHTPFKIEAFIRLSAHCIDTAHLRYLNRRDFRYTPKTSLHKMFTAIESAGWQVTSSSKVMPCRQCNGYAEIALKSISANSVWIDHNRYPCPDCNARGNIPLQVFTCSRGTDQPVIFEIPEIVDA
jgi:hypothetical protein